MHISQAVLREVAANPLVLKLEGTDETVLTLKEEETIAINPSPELVCDDFQVPYIRPARFGLRQPGAGNYR